MDIGKLRHRLGLQNKTTTQNAYGEPVDTYTTSTTVWGSINPLSAQEAINAQQANMEITHKVTIRYSATTATYVLGTTRILFGTRVFEVTSITKPDEIKEQYELLCKEIL